VIDLQEQTSALEPTQRRIWKFWQTWPAGSTCGAFSQAKVLYEILDLPRLNRSSSQRIDGQHWSQRTQFLAARASARRLLRTFGFANAEITRNPDRSPGWPTGIVGSIAHSERYVFVAVARQDDVRGLGIDVETIISPEIHNEIGSVFLNNDEMSLVGNVDRPLASTICFSAKEALFKCLYPLVGRIFDFKDAEVTKLDYLTGELSIRLISAISDDFPSGFMIEGSFRYDDHNVFTAFEFT
jgi:enterobactin synthetase component D